MYEGEKNMSQSMVNFTKGIVAGAVVGTTVGIVIHSISKPTRPFSGLRKKNAGRIVKNIGTVVSHMTDMIK